jgi:hypothetical protein
MPNNPINPLSAAYHPPAVHLGDEGAAAAILREFFTKPADDKFVKMVADAENGSLLELAAIVDRQSFADVKAIPGEIAGRALHTLDTVMFGGGCTSINCEYHVQDKERFTKVRQSIGVVIGADQFATPQGFVSLTPRLVGPMPSIHAIPVCRFV